MRPQGPRAADAGSPRGGRSNGQGTSTSSATAVVFVDIDRTLLDRSGELPAANRRAVDAARSAGACVILATARSYPGARDVHAALELDTPLVVGNGTYVCAPNGTTLVRTAIGDPRVDAVLERLGPREGRIALRTDRAVFFDTGSFDPTGTPYQHEARRHWDPARPDTRPDADAILRIAVWGDDAEHVAHGLGWDELDLRASYYPSQHGGTAAAAVSCRRATKGAAARWVRSHLGLDGAPTFAIGDNLDDLPLFELGRSAAPADAHDEVRASADWIAPPCDRASVAAAFAHFGLVDATAGSAA